ncbi:MAG: zf-HC2 domain-containing protein [Acidimicrobiales bacterium]|jgi:predicted anti-sigma-YlaC factor YlaD
MMRDLGDGDQAALCSTVREYISASLDGEATDELSLEAARHLSSCRGCRDFEQTAAVLTRQLRIHVLEATPDLSEEILRKISAKACTTAPIRPARRRRAARPSWPTRWAAAVVPLALALSGLSSSAFAHPRIVPTHPPTSCTAALRHH